VTICLLLATQSFDVYKYVAVHNAVRNKPSAYQARWSHGEYAAVARVSTSPLIMGVDVVNNFTSARRPVETCRRGRRWSVRIIHLSWCFISASVTVFYRPETLSVSAHTAVRLVHTIH